jgi:hypothetical protein
VEEPTPEEKDPQLKAETEQDADSKLNPKAEGELGLVATVLGCRENRDRIEFAQDLKDYIARSEGTVSDKDMDKKEQTITS